MQIKGPRAPKPGAVEQFFCRKKDGSAGKTGFIAASC